MEVAIPSFDMSHFCVLTRLRHVHGFFGSLKAYILRIQYIYTTLPPLGI